MIVCPNCGRTLAEYSETCQFCGSTLTQIKPSTSLEGKASSTVSKQKIALIITIIVLAIAVIISGVVMFTSTKNKSENSEKNEHQKVTEHFDKTLNESTTKQKNSSDEESDIDNSSDTEQNSENADNNTGINDAQIRKITNDTPAHAGVNLRKLPDSESELIMVLPEDTEVILLDEVADSDSYWKISVKVDGKEYTGYVLERYVSTFSGVEFSHRVCYSTPDHAGVVLRSEASSNSDKIIVLPEGTELRVWSLQDGSGDVYNETYWSVDAFYNGTIYKGYVLQKYIEEK